MSSFRVGQKVVCINGSFKDSDKYAEFIALGGRFAEKGAVYTIRDKAFHDGESGVWLEEIVNPKVPIRGHGIREPGFKASHFRPLVERKTDISIFKAMLNPSKKRVEA